MPNQADIDRQLRGWVERRDDDLLQLIGCCNDVELCNTEIDRLIKQRNAETPGRTA